MGRGESSDRDRRQHGTSVTTFAPGRGVQRPDRDGPPRDRVGNDIALSGFHTQRVVTRGGGGGHAVTRRHRRVTGAHILAHHGADLIHPIAVAMKAPGGTVDPVLEAFHVHPTLGEVVQTVATTAIAAG
jgi:hypothetical protein